MTEKTAIIIGATGLVGKNLVKLCLEDNTFDKVIILVRRESPFSHTKLEEHIIDFDREEDYIKWIKGDVLFSCLGTTKSAAGSTEAQYKVDYTYQYRAAEAAKKNGVPSYVLVSSAGADPEASFFYMKMKGELDEAVKKLNFEHTTILRPNSLTGDRKDTRIGEEIAVPVLRFMSKIIPPLKKYKPVHANDVARCMIHLYKKESKNYHIVSFNQVNELADQI